MSVLTIFPWFQGLVGHTESITEHFGGGEFSLKPAWTRELILWRGWPCKPVGCKQQHNSKIANGGPAHHTDLLTCGSCLCLQQASQVFHWLTDGLLFSNDLLSSVYQIQTGAYPSHTVHHENLNIKIKGLSLTPNILDSCEGL